MKHLAYKTKEGDKGRRKPKVAILFSTVTVTILLLANSSPSLAHGDGGGGERCGSITCDPGQQCCGGVTGLCIDDDLSCPEPGECDFDGDGQDDCTAGQTCEAGFCVTNGGGGGGSGAFGGCGIDASSSCIEPDFTCVDNQCVTNDCNLTGCTAGQSCVPDDRGVFSCQGGGGFRPCQETGCAEGLVCTDDGTCQPPNIPPAVCDPLNNDYSACECGPGAPAQCVAPEFVCNLDTGGCIPAPVPPPVPTALVVDGLGTGQGIGGGLFSVNLSSGGRTVISDFGNPALGPRVSIPSSVALNNVSANDVRGAVLVLDLGSDLAEEFGGRASTGRRGALFSVITSGDQAGQRRVVTDFGSSAQGTLGSNPGDLAVEPSGDILVIDFDSGIDDRGALFRVFTSGDRFGNRELLSDLGDDAQGPLGLQPGGVAIEPSGTILVADLGADFADESGRPSTGLRGGLFRIDPSTGARTAFSDFGDPGQGDALGSNPFRVAVDASGNIVVLDFDVGELEGIPGGTPGLFSVNPTTGFRTLLSDFGDVNQGPTGENPVDVAFDESGNILVTDTDAGADDRGVLFSVNPLNGSREIISNFANDNQGPLGVDPAGLSAGTTQPAP